MPVYQGERFVSKSIESILAQTVQAIELIIVNDGSSDNSAQIVSAYLGDPRVIYIEQDNQGVATARNTALRHATGDYIGLCDQDDEWLPHKAAMQSAYLDANPQAGMVHGDVEYIDSEGRPLPHDPYFPKNISGNCFATLFTGNAVMAVAAMARRSIINELGGFDPSIKYSDDYDLWLRITAEHEVGYIDEPVARYRWHENNNSHHHLAIRQNTLKVLRKIEKSFPAKCAEIDSQERRARYFKLYEKMAKFAFGIIKVSKLPAMQRCVPGLIHGLLRSPQFRRASRTRRAGI